MSRIYVACIAAYNAGKLHGVWIDLHEHIEVQEIEAEIDDMIKRSPVPFAEEWRIDDLEDFPRLGTEDLDTIVAAAKLVHSHGVGAVNAFIGHIGQPNVKAQIDEFNDLYIGCFKSEAHFCQAHLGEEGGLCDAAQHIQVFDYSTLDQYIDWEAIANDAFINGYWSYTEGYEQVHVFCRE